MSDQDLIAEGRNLLEAATSAPWQNDPHAHLERGCRCLSCHGPATVWQTSNMLACSDIEPDHRCDELGHTYADAELIVHMRNTYSELLDKLDTALIRVNQLEGDARLASACRPPEIRDRPSDADLSRLVRALEGTGDPLHVLGSELLELRGDQNAGLVLARDAAELKAEQLKMQLDEQGMALNTAQARIAELEANIPQMPRDLTLARVRIRVLEDELKRRATGEAGR